MAFYVSTTGVIRTNFAVELPSVAYMSSSNAKPARSHIGETHECRRAGLTGTTGMPNRRHLDD
ncbi:MAG: hypothetical protein ACREX9_09655 [Gammaproteobacteria bacterium]